MTIKTEIPDTHIRMPGIFVVRFILPVHRDTLKMPCAAKGSVHAVLSGNAVPSIDSEVHCS